MFKKFHKSFILATYSLKISKYESTHAQFICKIRKFS